VDLQWMAPDCLGRAIPLEIGLAMLLYGFSLKKRTGGERSSD
jgi:hypothetical protein